MPKFNVVDDGWIPIERAVASLDSSNQRVRRAIARLQLPVLKSKTSTFVRETDVSRIREAWTDGTIRRGRPRKKKADARSALKVLPQEPTGERR